jgi:flagellar basal-body rod protein FlgG
MPEITMPANWIQDSVTVNQDGRVSCKIPGNDDPIPVGQMNIFRFANPAGMNAIGENLLKPTNASGDPIGGRPGFDGMGKLQQRFLEMSNVSVVQEMVNMIVAQRAYELNSKSIQTSDTMLGIAANLKR